MNLKPLSLFTMPLLAVLLFSQSPVAFADQAKDNIKAKTEISASSVTLNWDKIGTDYKVYKDGKLIGETRENTFVDTTVKPDELYKYHIVVYDGDQLIDTVRISTKAKSSLDNSSLKKVNQINVPDMTIESIAGSDFVTLNWPEIPDDDNVYEVYRDGSLLASVSGRQFNDENVTHSTTYRYSVIGKKKLSEDEIKNIKKELDDNSANVVSDEELHKRENTFEAIKFVKTIDSNLEANLEESRLMESNLININSSSPYFSFRYMTFIPDARVPIPFIGGLGYYFLGNNRGFNVLSESYKTQQNIDVTFDEPSYSTYNQRTGVGETVIVDEGWVYQDADTVVCTPSNGKYKLYLLAPNSYGTDLKQFGAGASCGIPFFDNFTPDIDHYYDAWIERDGDWRVKGSHDKAPSHEFYIYDRSSSSYTTIFQHSVLRKPNGEAEFNALLPSWDDTYFDISG
ncbi:hypothetical protein [Paenibacillus eucommiae]|uniref:Uncharacterized protein n=1 Tax=Paenibacillus eucommiae TaxID=1355755 RepID=A0ABS4IVH9_9BACL|nr:hypothetical protein [Paenibacillus eucommiae]MBP1991595.1 hypothetical protein [Paenibacillus eucommiae]